VSITFVGTFKSENEVYNSIILTGRRYAQEVEKKLGVAHQVYVRIDEPENAEKVCAYLDAELPKQFPFKTATKDQRSFITTSIEDLQDQIRLSRIVIIITLSVMLVAIANTISMATRDRQSEFGILRAIGFHRRHIIGLVLTESTVIALAGGLLGLGISFALLNLQDMYHGVRGVNLLIHVTPPVMVWSLVVAAAVGVFGGILPALFASRTSIVNSLRNVE